MNKKILLLFFSYLLLGIGGLCAQVGINTENPNKLTEFEVTNLKDGTSGETIPKGIMIPRMTEDERKGIDVSDASTANSLMIYNIDEDCYNYYSKMDEEWKSLCGALGKGAFTFDCGDVIVKGTYIEGKELTGSNYLSIKVNVTKAGTYTISGSTDNGYGFFVSGTFMATGEQTLMVPGQGIPIAVQTDIVTMNNNGVEMDCSSNPVTVEVLTAAGTYSMLCGTAKQYGSYKVGVVLNPLNDYIELPITVTALGSYEITSNTVDGISFSASGTFSATGTNTIKLEGNGIPTSINDKTLVLTANSNGEIQTCEIIVRITIPKKKILTLGHHSQYGYNWAGNTSSHVYRMLNSSSNFGTNPNTSTVMSEGYEFVSPGNETGASNFASLISTHKPDIVQIGYSLSMAGAASEIKDYLEKGGIVIFLSESNAGVQAVMRSVFDNTSIGTAALPGSGRVMRLPMYDDEILKGPFGDIRGLQWADDGAGTTALTSFPLEDLAWYTVEDNLSSDTETSGSRGRVTAFRHKKYNLIFFGDGGFTAGQINTYGSVTSYPLTQVFTINNATEAKPVANTTPYGTNSSQRFNVYNSIIIANTMAWAIREAELNGYNKR